MQARQHFYGLREACPNLCAFALFDRLNLPDDGSPVLGEYSWQKREIENYLCTKDVLLRWVNYQFPLFHQKMEESISEVEGARRILGQTSPWDVDTKVSEESLAPLFRSFHEKTGMLGQIPKSDYHFLVRYMDESDVDPEVVSVLDSIVDVASRSQSPVYRVEDIHQAIDG